MAWEDTVTKLANVAKQPKLMATVARKEAGYKSALEVLAVIRHESPCLRRGPTLQQQALLGALAVEALGEINHILVEYDCRVCVAEAVLPIT